VGTVHFFYSRSDNESLLLIIQMSSSSSSSPLESTCDLCLEVTPSNDLFRITRVCRRIRWPPGEEQAVLIELDLCSLCRSGLLSLAGAYIPSEPPSDAFIRSFGEEPTREESKEQSPPIVTRQCSYCGGGLDTCLDNRCLNLHQ